MSSIEPMVQIPIELLEQFERGNVLLFVGERINRGVLPSAAELAQGLAERCDYPSGEPLTLPRAPGQEQAQQAGRGLNKSGRSLSPPNKLGSLARDAVRLGGGHSALGQNLALA
jgi:hypothetical protein